MMTQSWVVPTHIMFNVLSRCKKKHVRIFFSFGLWYTALQLKKIYLYVRKIHVMMSEKAYTGTGTTKVRTSRSTDRLHRSGEEPSTCWVRKFTEEWSHLFCVYACGILVVWQTTETQLTVLQLIRIVLVLVVLVELSLLVLILILILVCSV